MHIQVGSTIDNTFRVEKELGEGAAGKTFIVSLVRPWAHNSEGAMFCLKWYKDDILVREGFDVVMARRVRESFAGMCLAHPNLVRTYDTSEFWANDNPRYLVMELIAGQSLDCYIKSKWPLSFDEASGVILGIASGLAALHEKGIVHRDVKTQNVRMRPDGTAVLLDFGVVAVAADPTITDSQGFLGSLRYAAPEWLFGDECTTASDVYSLGTIAYNLLTGHEIYEDIKLFSRLVVAVQTQNPAIPSSGEDASRIFALDLISRMLNKNGQNRPSLPSVIEFFHSLDRSAMWNIIRLDRLQFLIPNCTASKHEHHLKMIGTALKDAPQIKDIDQCLALRDPSQIGKLSQLSDIVAFYSGLASEEGYRAAKTVDERAAWIKTSIDWIHEQYGGKEWIDLWRPLNAFCELMSTIERDPEIIQDTIDPCMESIRRLVWEWANWYGDQD